MAAGLAALAASLVPVVMGNPPAGPTPEERARAARDAYCAHDDNVYCAPAQRVYERAARAAGHEPEPGPSDDADESVLRPR